MSDNKGFENDKKDAPANKVALSEKSDLNKIATVKLPTIIKGSWYNEKNEELSQINGVDKNVVYGEKVKIKILTSNAVDGDLIEVEVKGKIGDTPIYLDPGTGTMKNTLEVKNNEATSAAFNINRKWYNEDKENYNYDEKHKNYKKTEIDEKELLTFVFDAKFLQGKSTKEIDLPKEDILKLKPVTYLRNYEELIGLFNTDHSGTKHKEQNYENKFIDTNLEIKGIVDEFIEKVVNTDSTQIRSLVEKQAKALWQAAIKQAQGGNLDDRPLYWARIKMQTWLKRVPYFKNEIDREKSLVKKGSELDKLIILFEDLSRNYTGIDFGIAAGKKKILITGFDPFFLNSWDPHKNDYNILQSNPSGCVALSLDSQIIGNAFIRTLIVPVRYTDFDGSQKNDKGEGTGIIEEHIGKLLNNVDMIVTMSQYKKDENVIDMFSTLTRGGGNGNNDFIRIPESKAMVSKDKWIKTSLPTEFASIPGVKMNWGFNNKPRTANTFPPKNQELKQGSGGDYLSNEIFYRVAKLRKDNKPNLPTGHFHIERLQNSTKEDFSNTKMTALLELIKKSFEQAIKKLNME